MIKLMKSKGFLLANLAILAQAQPTATFVTQNTTQLVIYILLIVILTAFSFFIFYDRRQNYIYLRAARDAITRKWNAMITKLRTMRQKTVEKQKLGPEEQMSDKPTIGFIQSQKTYIEADIISIQQTANTSSSLPEQMKQSIQLPQSPQVSLKQAFGKKQKKEGNRSRSKLKNRVQIKKSQLENEEFEKNQVTNEELQNSIDNSEG